MPVTDPIADMLTRIRNAQMVSHPAVEMPSSRSKAAVADILKREGYIEDYEVTANKPQDRLKVALKYDGAKPAIRGLRRVSKPGLRVSVQRKEAPRAFNGVGISIVSTSKGVMTGREAWRQGLGGELWAYVW